jgi:hypothetical protein
MPLAGLGKLQVIPKTSRLSVVATLKITRGVSNKITIMGLASIYTLIERYVYTYPGDSRIPAFAMYIARVR